MKKLLSRFQQKWPGITAGEYALIGVLTWIAAVIGFRIIRSHL